MFSIKKILQLFGIMLFLWFGVSLYTTCIDRCTEAAERSKLYDIIDPRIRISLSETTPKEYISLAKIMFEDGAMRYRYYSVDYILKFDSPKDILVHLFLKDDTGNSAGEDPKRSFTVKIDNVLVGQIWFSKTGTHSANVGYWLSKDYRGRGIMGVVLRQFTKYVLLPKEIICIVFECYEDNLASISTIESFIEYLNTSGYSLTVKKACLRKSLAGYCDFGDVCLILINKENLKTYLVSKKSSVAIGGAAAKDDAIIVPINMVNLSMQSYCWNITTYTINFINI